MDASDIIKSLRDKTVYYNKNEQLKLRYAEIGKQLNQIGANNSTFNQFISYEQKYEFFEGRYDVGNSCSTCSTSSQYCLQ